MKSKDGVVVSLCDLTGIMVLPWAQAGYECWCVDLQHSGKRRVGNIVYIGADVLDWKFPRGVDCRVVFAFPPCTDLASSGARWWKGKGLHKLARAIDLVACCVDLCEQQSSPWMLENPVGSLSSYWREPDFLFDPCDYSGYLRNAATDAYTKKTCLWIGNGFLLPKPRKVAPILGSKIHRIPPSADRQNLRSVTPGGFAEAVFQVNTGLVKERYCKEGKTWSTPLF